MIFFFFFVYRKNDTTAVSMWACILLYVYNIEVTGVNERKKILICLV